MTDNENAVYLNRIDEQALLKAKATEATPTLSFKSSERPSNILLPTNGGFSSPEPLRASTNIATTSSANDQLVDSYSHKTLPPEQVKVLEEEVASLKLQLEVENRSRCLAERSITSLQSQSEDNRIQFSLANNRITDMSTQIQQLDLQLKEATSVAIEAGHKRELAVSQFEAVRSQTAVLEKDFTRLQTALALAHSEREEDRDALKKAHSRVQDMNREMLSQQTLLDASQNDLNEVNGFYKQLKIHVQTMQKDQEKDMLEEPVTEVRKNRDSIVTAAVSLYQTTSTSTKIDYIKANNEDTSQVIAKLQRDVFALEMNLETAHSQTKIQTSLFDREKAMRMDQAHEIIELRAAFERNLKLLSNTADMEIKLATMNGDKLALEEQLSVSRRNHDELTEYHERKNSDLKKCQRELAEAEVNLQLLDNLRRDVAVKESQVTELRLKLAVHVNTTAEELDTNQTTNLLLSNSLEATIVKLEEDLANKVVEWAKRGEDLEEATGELDAMVTQNETLQTLVVSLKEKNALRETENMQLKFFFEELLNNFEVAKKELVQLSGTLHTEKENVAQLSAQLEKERADSISLKRENLVIEQNLRRTEVTLESHQSELFIERTLKTDLENGVGALESTRVVTQKMLSEMQQKVLTLDDSLRETKKVKETAEQRNTEIQLLWEAEVTSRNKMGVRVIEMERLFRAFESQLDQEKRKNESFETRFEDQQQIITQLQRENSSLKDSVLTTERRVHQFELSNLRTTTTSGYNVRDESQLRARPFRTLDEKLRYKDRVAGEGDINRYFPENFQGSNILSYPRKISLYEEPINQVFSSNASDEVFLRQKLAERVGQAKEKLVNSGKLESSARVSNLLATARATSNQTSAAKASAKSKQLIDSVKAHAAWA